MEACPSWWQLLLRANNCGQKSSPSHALLRCSFECDPTCPLPLPHPLRHPTFSFRFPLCFPLLSQQLYWWHRAESAAGCGAVPSSLLRELLTEDTLGAAEALVTGEGLLGNRLLVLPGPPVRNYRTLVLYTLTVLSY